MSIKIDCAFCDTKGKDPFGIPSPLSNCQVCSGRGKVRTIYEKRRKCGFCDGSGKHPAYRLICPVCCGKGVVGVLKEPARNCPICGGTGIAKNKRRKETK